MRKKLMLPDNVNSKLKGLNTGKTVVKKDSESAKQAAANENKGDVSIRDIKKPEEVKKELPKVPSIKVENLDSKPAEKADKPKI